MRLSLKVACLAAALAFLGVSGVARAEDAKDLKSVARGLAAKAQKSVVTIRLVVKLSMGGRDREVKVEATGTVIDPSGLTVISASEVDPASSFRAMLGGRRGRGGAGGAGADMKIESDVTETTLVLEDGTEIESDVVLKDNELDLAFVRPHDTTNKFEAVALKPTNAAPQLLDDVIVVGRLGRTANRASSLQVGTIKAVVKGPRTFYVCDDELAATSVGCVAYAADGSPLGVFVTKTSTGEEGRRGGALVILRSVEDVIEIANQAKTAKAPEKKAKPAAEKDDDEEKPAAKEAPKGDSKKDDSKKDEKTTPKSD